jgi:hypothetical protein
MCAGDNKNSFVFLFLAILVAIGLFDKVKISFLIVGHTHEDIDQLFSKFAGRLRTHDAITLMELALQLSLSFKGKASGQMPKAEIVTNLPDFKRWLGNMTFPKFHNISVPRCFLLKVICSRCVCLSTAFCVSHKSYVCKRVGDDVRIWSRDTMSETKAQNPLCWLPESGYFVVNKTDAGCLWQMPLPAVVHRGVDTTALQKTVACLRNELTAEQNNAWQERLDQLVALAGDQCPQCVDFRANEALSNPVTNTCVTFMYLSFHIEYPCYTHFVFLDYQ